MNNSLPITACRVQIMEAVRANNVVIIRAETGAGKSTQVPQYLLAEGFRVLVTQPRRLAASSVAERVSEELGSKLGDVVGFRTARDRQDSERTQVLFATEGLALVRELVHARRGYDIIVLDEVHEWSRDMEILLAWLRREQSRGARFKLVCMSATMDAAALSLYFGRAPVIDVPGRAFPVVRQQAAQRDYNEGLWAPRAMVADIKALVAERRNVLVFCPGKAEIAEIADALASTNAEVIPLHGEQTRVEQAAAFRRYSNPKVIVATNVAQTSITIDDCDAVVDSGLERRTEVCNGVEGLYLRVISLADSLQREGRAGRVKKGIYIDHAHPDEPRTDYPVPEIQRVRPDQAVLRLAMVGVDLEELDLFHPVSSSEVHSAKGLLRTLGCMSEDGAVTEVGARVAQLPVGVRAGRMLVEAATRGVVDEVATIAAIIEARGIFDSRVVDDRKQPVWRKLITDPKSDHLTGLDAYNKANVLPQRRWREVGINSKGMREARATRQQILEAARRHLREEGCGGRDDVLKSVVVGLLDCVHTRTTNKWGDLVYGADHRRLARECVINPSDVELIVGQPFNVKGEKRMVPLIELCSEVKPDWLVEIAPQLVTVEQSTPHYDYTLDQVRAQVTVRFNGNFLLEKRVVVEGAPASRALENWLAGAMLGWNDVPLNEYGDAINYTVRARQRMSALNARAGSEAYAMTDAQLKAFVSAAVGSATRLADIKPDALRIGEPSEAEVRALYAACPDQIDLLGSPHIVSYTRNGPVVTLRSGDNWRLLPDDEVRLPGGRLVTIQFLDGYVNVFNSDMRAFKSDVARRFALIAFDQWVWNSPDLAEDQLGVVVEREYAHGEIAYGTFRDGRSAKSSWTIDRAEAERWALAERKVRAENDLYTATCRLPHGHALSSSAAPDTLEEIVAATAACNAAADALEAGIAAEEAELNAGTAAVISACESTVEKSWRRTPSRALARAVFVFVRDIMRIRPSHIEAVALIFRAEANAIHGRDQRRRAIVDNFPESDWSRFNWAAGADIITIAAYAAACAESQVSSAPAISPKEPAKTNGSPTKADIAAFRDRFNKRR